LEKVLIPSEKWKPFPVYEERNKWEKIPLPLKKYYIKIAEKNIDFEWKTITARKYLDFIRTGNRTRCQKIYFEKRKMLSDFVIGECIEGKGKFLDQIINGIWAICEESSWCIPAHIREKRGKGLPDITNPEVDLFAAETSSLLALTGYLLKKQIDKISPYVYERICYEIKNRILKPLLERDDFWWMGFLYDKGLNNWNPWINSNWLISNLLIEKNSAERINAILKSMKSIDKYLQSVPGDGGCDEGPGYWNVAGGKLFIFLEFLRYATNNKIDIYNHTLIKEMGRYIYRVHINKNYFVNFADCPGIVNPSPVIVYGYGKRIKDKEMQSLGRYLFKLNSGKINGYNLISRLLLFSKFLEIHKYPSYPPLISDFWFKKTQVLIAREKET